jgi:hypothetical protein
MFVSDISNGVLSNEVGNFGKSVLVSGDDQTSDGRQTFPPPPPSAKFVDSFGTSAIGGSSAPAGASFASTVPVTPPPANPALLARAIQAYTRTAPEESAG